jgi:GNAT superfamily N-acetyltransferase
MVTLSYPLAIRCGGVYACIEEFVVGPQARGKGVGGLLLEAAIRRAREMGCAEIQVKRPSQPATRSICATAGRTWANT